MTAINLTREVTLVRIKTSALTCSFCWWTITLVPIFADNDNFVDAAASRSAQNYAIIGTAQRMLSIHGNAAAQQTALQAQQAFWQNRMTAYRWWQKIGYAIDQAILAGHSALPKIQHADFDQKRHGANR